MIQPLLDFLGSKDREAFLSQNLVAFFNTQDIRVNDMSTVGDVLNILQKRLLAANGNGARAEAIRKELDSLASAFAGSDISGETSDSQSGSDGDVDGGDQGSGEQDSGSDDGDDTTQDQDGEDDSSSSLGVASVEKETDDKDKVPPLAEVGGSKDLPIDAAITDAPEDDEPEAFASSSAPTIDLAKQQAQEEQNKQAQANKDQANLEKANQEEASRQNAQQQADSRKDNQAANKQQQIRVQVVKEQNNLVEGARAAVQRATLEQNIVEERIEARQAEARLQAQAEIVALSEHKHDVPITLQQELAQAEHAYVAAVSEYQASAEEFQVAAQAFYKAQGEVAQAQRDVDEVQEQLVAAEQDVQEHATAVAQTQEQHAEAQAELDAHRTGLEETQTRVVQARAAVTPVIEHLRSLLAQPREQLSGIMIFRGADPIAPTVDFSTLIDADAFADLRFDAEVADGELPPAPVIETVGRLTDAHQTVLQRQQTVHAAETAHQAQQAKTTEAQTILQQVAGLLDQYKTRHESAMQRQLQLVERHTQATQSLQDAQTRLTQAAQRVEESARRFVEQSRHVQQTATHLADVQSRLDMSLGHETVAKQDADQTQSASHSAPRPAATSRPRIKVKGKELHPSLLRLAQTFVAARDRQLGSTATILSGLLPDHEVTFAATNDQQFKAGEVVSGPFFKSTPARLSPDVSDIAPVHVPGSQPGAAP